MRWKGYGGLLAAGFWGNTWEYEPYLAYSTSSDALLPQASPGSFASASPVLFTLLAEALVHRMW